MEAPTINELILIYLKKLYNITLSFEDLVFYKSICDLIIHQQFANCEILNAPLLYASLISKIITLEKAQQSIGGGGQVSSTSFSLDDRTDSVTYAKPFITSLNFSTPSLENNMIQLSVKCPTSICMFIGGKIC